MGKDVISRDKNVSYDIVNGINICYCIVYILLIFTYNTIRRLYYGLQKSFLKEVA